MSTLNYYFLTFFFILIIVPRMGCLSATAVAEIKAEIVKLDIYIAAAEEAYLASLGNAEIVRYKFGSGSGEGLQDAERRSPKVIREEIEALQASKSRLERKLLGTLNVNMNLRRRRGACY